MQPLKRTFSQLDDFVLFRPFKKICLPGNNYIVDGLNLLKTWLEIYVRNIDNLSLTKDDMCIDRDNTIPPEKIEYEKDIENFFLYFFPIFERLPVHSSIYLVFKPFENKKYKMLVKHFKEIFMQRPTLNEYHFVCSSRTHNGDKECDDRATMHLFQSICGMRNTQIITNDRYYSPHKMTKLRSDLLHPTTYKLFSNRVRQDFFVHDTRYLSINEVRHATLNSCRFSFAIEGDQLKFNCPLLRV